MIYGVILVAMMLFRPEGLIPSRQRKAELHAADSDPRRRPPSKSSTPRRRTDAAIC